MNGLRFESFGFSQRSKALTRKLPQLPFIYDKVTSGGKTMKMYIAFVTFWKQQLLKCLIIFFPK